MITINYTFFGILKHRKFTQLVFKSTSRQDPLIVAIIIYTSSF